MRDMELAKAVSYIADVLEWDEDEDWRGGADVHEDNLMWCHHTQHEIITDPFSWA